MGSNFHSRRERDAGGSRREAGPRARTAQARRRRSDRAEFPGRRMRCEPPASLNGSAARRAAPAQKNFFAFSKKEREVGSLASPLTFANSSRIRRCSELRLVGTSTCTRTN